MAAGQALSLSLFVCFKLQKHQNINLVNDIFLSVNLNSRIVHTHFKKNKHFNSFHNFMFNFLSLLILIAQKTNKPNDSEHHNRWNVGHFLHR